jgi:hypothetical protein
LLHGGADVTFEKSNVGLEKASAVKKFAVSLYPFAISALRQSDNLWSSLHPSLLGTHRVRIILVNTRDPVSIQ